MPQVLNIHPNYNIWRVPKKCQKYNSPSVEYSPKLQYLASAQKVPKIIMPQVLNSHPNLQNWTSAQDVPKWSTSVQYSTQTTKKLAIAQE